MDTAPVCSQAIGSSGVDSMPLRAYDSGVAPVERMTLKPLVWVRSSKEDLKTFPRIAQSHLGFALKVAQSGGKHPDAKPMRGFSGASVIEIVEDFDRNTYRAVYTVKVCRGDLCPSCFSEEIQVRHRRAETRSRSDRRTIETREGVACSEGSLPEIVESYE
jgi:phage-related protein